MKTHPYCGFMVIDKLTKNLMLMLIRIKFKGIYVEVPNILGEDVKSLVKPTMTYESSGNLSLQQCSF